MCCESRAKNALQVATHPGQSDGDRNDKREHDRGGKNNERNWGWVGIVSSLLRWWSKSEL